MSPQPTNTNSTSAAGRKPETPAKSGHRPRPNAMRNVQVMPPHNVDLTLSPTAHADMHVPAHVSGADLSREGPADADLPTKDGIRKR